MKMQAMLLREYNRPMELAEMEIPKIDGEEILLRVKACGVCLADLKIFRGEILAPIVTLPHVPGHEVAGEMVAVGEKVSGVKKGMRGYYIFM
jgi:D-arabinose 1-dehydrogenase-like Zn-dependent alcohol dehydrogenase